MPMDLLPTDSKRRGDSRGSSREGALSTQDVVLTLRTRNKVKLNLNAGHLMRVLDVILKIAPQELRAPGGNTDFLMDLYDMRQRISEAVKKEREANERSFVREMAAVEKDITGSLGADTSSLDMGVQA